MSRPTADGDAAGDGGGSGPGDGDRTGAATRGPDGLPAETPPGPDGRPLLGSVRPLVRDPWAFFEDLAGYGDVVAYDVPGYSFCTVLHPDLIERVLVTDHERFGKFGFEELFGAFAAEGLLFTEGEQWRRQRTAIQAAFTMERVREYGEAMVRRTETVVDRWDDGAVVAVDEAFSELALSILTESLFDLDLGDGDGVVREFADAVNARGDLDGLSTFLPLWVPTRENRRYRRAMDEFRAFVDGLVDERRGRTDGADDLLSVLLSATDDQGRGLSETEVRDQLVTFLFAGHETTSAALTYAVLLLAQHDDVRRRLDAEHEAVLGGEPPGLADLPALTYTERVVDETLRLYPPAYVLFREVREAVELGGYRVPEGTTLTLPQFHVHTDERWYDDPETFDPDRWTEERSADRPEYAYFPFGGGPRHCIGMRFARMELKTVLATVAQRFAFELCSDPDPDLEMGATLQPSEPVRVRLHER